MLFDVVALVLGIFFTIRKLDVRKREASDFPAVDRAGFERWKATALLSYNLGSFGCFAKIALDYGFQFLAARIGLAWSVVRGVGFSLFVVWVGVVVLAWVQSARARRLRDELGIRLEPVAPAPP